MNNEVAFRSAQPCLCQQRRKGEHGGAARAAAWLHAAIALRTAPEQKPLKGVRTQWWSLAAFQHAGAHRREVAGWGPHVQAGEVCQPNKTPLEHGRGQGVALWDIHVHGGTSGVAGHTH